MAEDDLVGTFEFRTGPLRGGRLTLHPTRLVCRAGGSIESVQLGAVGAVRVAFERDARKIGWAVALAIIALVLFMISSPLATWGAHAATDVLGQLHKGGGSAPHTIGGILLSVLQAFARLARLLPLAATLVSLWAIAWAALGVLGTTTLTLTVGPAERAYPVRGRNTRLLDFAEAISTGVAQLHR